MHTSSEITVCMATLFRSHILVTVYYNAMYTYTHTCIMCKSLCAHVCTYTKVRVRDIPVNTRCVSEARHFAGENCLDARAHLLLQTRCKMVENKLFHIAELWSGLALILIAVRTRIFALIFVGRVAYSRPNVFELYDCARLMRLSVCRVCMRVYV